MATETPAPFRSPSQRTLAAIVFTDVVSFSARMHSDEVATLQLLQRDFAEMRRLCAEYKGEVLKTTGDGLLLTFTSAVQAVACALAMQRQFAAEAKDRPPGGALQHRIGIHLGDVLVQDKDVMGDGVNIASRLQAEAEPGGICISQTVYDVVKNKLEMKVVSLGARDLKNIAQAMPVYRLILEAQTLDSASKARADARVAGPRQADRGHRGGGRAGRRPRGHRVFQPPLHRESRNRPGRTACRPANRGRPATRRGPAGRRPGGPRRGQRQGRRPRGQSRKRIQQTPGRDAAAARPLPGQVRFQRPCRGPSGQGGEPVGPSRPAADAARRRAAR